MWNVKDKFLGIRIPEELESKLILAAQKLNEKNKHYWGRRTNKSKVACNIMEEFFNGTNEYQNDLQKLGVVKQKAGGRPRGR